MLPEQVSCDLMLDVSTHKSLLARLGDREDSSAWTEFCHRYGALIQNFARRRGLQEAEREDILQEVLFSLMKSMPGFEYDPSKGKFRSYLKTVVLHTIYRKSCQSGREQSLEDVGPAVDAAMADMHIEESWEHEWRQYHLRRAMRKIDAEFNETDRTAFELYALEGQDVSEVGAVLGLSTDQVYQAKSRIKNRLTELIDQQVEEEG